MTLAAPKYQAPGETVTFNVNFAYCPGVLVLQEKRHGSWVKVDSKRVRPTTSHPCLGPKPQWKDFIPFTVTAPKNPALVRYYRAISTTLGYKSRTSNVERFQANGATLEGTLTNRTTGDDIKFSDFNNDLVETWRKTKSGSWKRFLTGSDPQPLAGGTPGEYIWHHMRPGAYKIRYVNTDYCGLGIPTCSISGLATQWYGDSDTSGSAKTVILKPGGTVRHVNVSFPPGMDIWVDRTDGEPLDVGGVLWPDGEHLSPFRGQGPSTGAIEFLAVPLTMYRVVLNPVVRNAGWVPTWYVSATDRAAATSFPVTSTTMSSPTDPVVTVQMIFK